jgi:hypothetical protein
MADGFTFVVVCEAEADCSTVTTLADRVLYDAVEWMQGQDLDGIRQWRGDGAARFVAWSTLRERTRGLRKFGTAYGHFGGEPGAPDAHAARRALLFLTNEGAPIDAVILVRDSDGDLSRARGLAQARESGRWRFAVIVGLAHTKRECWHLVGFRPRNAVETSRLAAV